MFRSLKQKTASVTNSLLKRSDQTAEAGNPETLKKSSHITNILLKYIHKGQRMFQVELDLLQDLTTALSLVKRAIGILNSNCGRFFFSFYLIP